MLSLKTLGIFCDLYPNILTLDYYYNKILNYLFSGEKKSDHRSLTLFLLRAV